jgi:hypothetical protein
LALSFSTEGPFALLSAEASIPQDAGATFFSVADFKQTASRASFLPPQESADVTIKLTPPANSLLADYQLQGDLIAHYSNGEEQRIPLRADILHPRLQCSLTTGAGAAEVDFGAVHPRAPKWIDILLTNTSSVNAIWQVHDSQAPAPVFSCDDGQVPTTAAIAAFQVLPSRGALPGRGLTAPQTQRVRLVFAPPDNRPHEVHVTFAVLGGRPCSIILKGQGTFDETSEFKAELQGL